MPADARNSQRPRIFGAPARPPGLHRHRKHTGLGAALGAGPCTVYKEH